MYTYKQLTHRESKKHTHIHTMQSPWTISEPNLSQIQNWSVANHSVAAAGTQIQCSLSTGSEVRGGGVKHSCPSSHFGLPHLVTFKLCEICGFSKQEISTMHVVVSVVMTCNTGDFSKCYFTTLKCINYRLPVTDELSMEH
jgi:hypothetical protein